MFAAMLGVALVSCGLGLGRCAAVGGAAVRVGVASEGAGSNRRRLSSMVFCISVLELSSRDTLAPLIAPPARIMPTRASSSVANTMNASPRSPPTMCTPPSGMVRPLKKWRMSMVPATIGKPCSRITTAMRSAYGQKATGKTRANHSRVTAVHSQSYKAKHLQT
uniref:Secreted protein n=1 Tax=Knipowitschia caucasica TaxID=637954 RepID=A0AAV2MHU3_KNICA